MTSRRPHGADAPARRRRPARAASLRLGLLLGACAGTAHARGPPPAAGAFVAPRRPRGGAAPTRGRPRPGWTQEAGEWAWEEDGPGAAAAVAATGAVSSDGRGAVVASAAPKLPSGSFKPKQSLGQNFLQDGNTILKIVRQFEADAAGAMEEGDGRVRPVELGPGAGAITGPLVQTFGEDVLRCIEIDSRAVELLTAAYPALQLTHMDVLQVDYPQTASDEGGPLSVVGNLPYYITSQILFALADASHSGAVRSATVTMQLEVAQRMVAATSTKDYGILSVVFQLYADVALHFKIPPTVFYPRPKVHSALVGLRFVGPAVLRRRLCGVAPRDLRRVVTSAFRQRRKTVRNGLKRVAMEVCGGDKERAADLFVAGSPALPASVAQRAAEGDAFALRQKLPDDWAKKRPEELSAGQFVELTRLIFGAVEPTEVPLEKKVWRKLKHGTN